MSSGVFKRGIGYTYQDEDARVIDTNSLMASRLEILAEVMEREAEKRQSFDDEFSAGIDALAVDRLLSDDDGMLEGEEGGEPVSRIIKASDAQEAYADAGARAQEMADEILSDARAQADAILAQAQEEAEEIRNQAMEEGRAMGYDAGYSEGSREANNAVSDKLNELEDMKAQLAEDFERQLSELEPMFIETLTDIYEHIFHVKLSDSKEVIFYLIQDAVRKVSGNRDFIIHVSKEDYGFVSMQKSELLAGIAGSDTAEIVEDMTLKANECFIETGGGIFDCSLETQLAGLKRELRLLSFVKD